MAGVDFTYTVGLDAQTDVLTKKVNAFRESIDGRPFNIKLDLQGFDTEKATQAFAQLGIEMDKIKTVTADVVTLVDKNGKIYQEAKGYTAQYTDELGRMTTAYMKIPTTIGDTAKKTKEYDAILKSTADTLNRTQNVDEKHRQGIEKTADEIKNSISSWKQLAEQYGASSPQAKELETKITGLVGTLKQQEGATKTAANAMQNFATRMGNAIKQSFAYSIALRGIRMAQQQLNEAIQYTIDLDTEMTKIKILQVEGAKTTAEIDRLANSFNRLAQEMGATTLQVAEGSVEWLRQGKTIEETSKLLKSTLMLSKLGNLAAADATEKLTSTLNGYKMEASEATSVVDKLVAVDNVAATSVKELTTALQYSAAVAEQTGVSFEQLVSYIGVVSETTRQNAESIGQGMKTMLTRMQDIKGGKLDEDGLGINNVEIALRRANIELRDSKSSFRDFGTVLEELAGEWDTLSETEQAFISKSIAGVRQVNMFTVLMTNMNRALELQNVQFTSAGLASSRYQLYMESLEAKIAQFKATLEGLYQDAIESGFIGSIIDAGTNILKMIEDMGGLEVAVKRLTAAFIALKIVMFTLNNLTTLDNIAKGIKAFAGFGLEGTLAGITEGLKDSGKGASALSTILKKLIPVTAKTSLSVSSTGTAATGAATGFGALASAALPWIAVGAVVIGTAIAIEKAVVTQKEAYEALIDAQEKATELGEQISSVEELKKRYDELRIAAQDNTKTQEEQIRARQQLDDVIDQLAEKLPGLTKLYGKEGESIGIVSTSYAELAENLKTARAEAEALAKVNAEQFLFNQTGGGMGAQSFQYSDTAKLEQLYRKANRTQDSDDWNEYYKKLGEYGEAFSKVGADGAESFIATLNEGINNDVKNNLMEMANEVAATYQKKVEEDGEKWVKDYWEGRLEYSLQQQGHTEAAIESRMKFGAKESSGQDYLDYLISDKIPALNNGILQLKDSFETLANGKIINAEQVESLRSLGIIVEANDDLVQELFYEYEKGGEVQRKQIKSSDDYADVLSDILANTEVVTPELLAYAEAYFKLTAEEQDALIESIKLEKQTKELAAAHNELMSKTSSLASAMEEQGKQGYISADTALQIAQSNGELFRSLEEVEGGYRLTQDAVNAQIQSLQNSMNAIFAEIAAGQYDAQVKEAMFNASKAAAEGNYALAISAIESAEEALKEAEAFGYLTEILERLADIDLAMPTFTGAGGYSGSGGSSARQEDPRIAENEEIIDQLEKQKKIHEDIIHLHEHEIHDIEDKIELLEHEIEAVEDIIEGYEEQIEAVEDIIEGYEEQIEAQEDIIDGHEKIIDAHEKDIDLLELEIDGYEKQKDAIEEARDIYHQWIDDKKESLELAKAESDYYSEQDKKVKDLAKIQQEIAVLSLDTSEEGRAKRLKLEEQAAGMQTGIEEDAGERRHQLQLQALENLRTSYDEIADKEIERFDNLISGVESQIALIEAAIEILNGYIEEAELIIEGINTQIESQEDIIKGIEDQIEIQEDIVKGIEDQIEVQQDIIHEINHLIDAQKHLIEPIDHKIEDIRDILEDIRKENKSGSGSGGSGGYSGYGGYNGTGNSDAEGGTPGAVIGYDKDRNPYYLSGDGTIIQGSYSQGTHKGINSVDIGGKLGDAVGAATGGELIATGEDSAHGKWLVVRGENGMDMRYYHLTDEDIAEAERKLASGDTQVTMGETIGHIGDTGNTAGNHYGLEVGIFQASFEDAMAAGLNMTEKQIEVMNRINSGMIPTAEAREWLTEVQDDVKDQDRIIALSADGVAKEVDITNKITETGLKTVKDGIDAGVLETNSVFDGGKITLEQALADNTITTQEAALLGIEANERFLNDNTLSLQQAMADGNISMEEALELGLLGVTNAAATNTENLKQGLIAGTITLGDAIGEDMVTLQGALADGVLDITEQDALGANAVTAALADGFISAEEAERLGFMNTGEKLDALTFVTAEGQKVTFNLTTNDDGEVGFQYTAPETTVPPTSDLPPIVKPGRGIAYHTGGFVGGLESNEIFAKLLKGEYVATEKQMDNFLKNVLPSIGANMPKYSNRYGSQNITVNMPITVEGNMDKTVIPQLDEISNKVIDNINKALVTRGYVRSANISLS